MMAKSEKIFWTAWLVFLSAFFVVVVFLGLKHFNAIWDWLLIMAIGAVFFGLVFVWLSDMWRGYL